MVAKKRNGRQKKPAKRMTFTCRGEKNAKARNK